jgi:hypothetical protein
MRIGTAFAAALSLASIVTHVQASPTRNSVPSVVCHITYGGETIQIAARPVTSPYAVEATQIGSYFLFRAVVQDTPADIASIKLYVYGDTDDGPVLIHQADHPYPPERQRSVPYGFTGHHRVYERIRDGELEYWCDWQTAPKAMK